MTMFSTRWPERVFTVEAVSDHRACLPQALARWRSACKLRTGPGCPSRGIERRRDEWRAHSRPDAAALLERAAANGISERSPIGAAGAAGRRRVIGHLSRRIAVRLDLRQARAGAAQGGGRLAGADRPQSLRGGVDAGGGGRRSRGRARGPRRGSRKRARSRWPGCRPTGIPVWKAQLRDGAIDAATAAAVGDVLGRIHAATADRPDVAARFPTDAIFYAIRLEPYLVATGRAHPELAPRLAALVATTQSNARVLVHGDFSPKNLLIGPDGPVILDAECAWFGDPAFDVAFVLNHLLLKGAWRPEWRARYLASFACAGKRLLRRTCTGSRPRAASAGRGAAARPAAGARRRQVAGRIRDRATPTRRASARSRGGCCWRRSRTRTQSQCAGSHDGIAYPVGQASA